VEILNPVKANSISDIVEAKSEHFDQMEWYKNKDFKFETRIIGEEGALILKIINACVKLDNIARASLGCQAYNSIKHTKEQIEKRVFHADSKLSSEYLPELAGNDVSRYSMNKLKGKWIKYGPWLHDYRTMDWLEGPRLLVREIPSQPPYQIQAYYTEETYCNYKTILNINPRIETKISMKYLCGLVNSRLISFIYPFISNKIVAKSFPRISVGDLRNIPVIDINFSDKKEVTAHDKIVSLVDQMLESKKQLQLSKTDKDKTYYERKCDALDKQIDSEVYKLYGLTEEEIKIVEVKE
jgi:hypothetical protein